MPPSPVKPAMMPNPAFHRGLMPALEPADMALRVELDPDAPDQIKLGFEEINMMLLVLHQHLE
jgi:hypothetical protein